MSINFSEKYKPSTPSEVIGNKSQITLIKDWLSKYKDNKKRILSDPKKRKKVKIPLADEKKDDSSVIPNEKIFAQKKEIPKSCLLVIGDHGVGKTCTVNACLKQMKYDIHTINLAKVSATKNYEDTVKKMFRDNNIFYHFENNKKENIAVVIDGIESAISPIEKNFILTLLKKNEEGWNFPVVFISNGKHSKITTILKKNANTVAFFPPTNENLLKLLIKISHNEKMKFESDTREKSEAMAKKLVAHCQKDFRRLTAILQDFKLEFGMEPISDENVDNYCKMTKMKDLDVDIYRASANMITNYNGIDDCLRLYEGEKVIIPLVMQQNCIKCISQYNKNGEKSFKLANKIATSMAFGDVVENHIYSDQNWDMQEVHGFLMCVSPAFNMFNEKMDINNESLRHSLNFPMDLNRTSIRKINKKNVVNSNNCLKNLEIKDFIFLNKLVRKLITDNKLKECANLFKKYKITIENLESILKIDKINETKTTLASQTKKTLSKYLTDQ